MSGRILGVRRVIVEESSVAAMGVGATVREPSCAEATEGRREARI